jgi:hypothetical protein
LLDPGWIKISNRDNHSGPATLIFRKEWMDGPNMLFKNRNILSLTIRDEDVERGVDGDS